jgi:dipeptidyl aminopeptidase/acylaminoacyl peptidase
MIQKNIAAMTRRKMRNTISAAAICGLLFSLPLAADVKPVTVDDLMKIRNVEDARISPAGDRVAFVISEMKLAKNVSDSDIWLVKTTGGTPLRLTYGPGRDDSPRWSPDGKTIAFISDRDGSNQIWLIYPEGGEAFEPAPVKGGVSNIAWSPDGTRIAFLAHGQKPAEEPKGWKGPEDVIVFDPDVPGLQIFVMDVATRQVTPMTRDSYAVVDFSWSPDGTKIVFAAQPSPRIRDLYKTDIAIVDLNTGAVRDLVKREGIDTYPRWSPDGRWIAFLSTDGKTGWIVNWYLCLVPAQGGTPRNITKKFDEFMFSPQWSQDGRTVIFQSSKGLGNQLYAVSPESEEIRPLLSGNFVWSDFSFSVSGALMAFIGSDPCTPSDVFVSKPDKFNPIRLTFSNPQLNDLTLGRQEVVHWKSSDGLEIEGLLLLPVGFVEGKPGPLLTYVHGGPSGRFEHSFSPQISSPYPVQAESYPLQVMAGLGYGVFMPNPRGSYGYGEKFRMANVKDWGGGDYRDIMSGIDYLIGRKVADPERLGIMGRSYGGYMTAWIISQTNRFKAASLGAGMSDLVSFYGQTDISGYLECYFGDVPWKALDLYNRLSPITHAANIKTPTLILHGEKDFRVPLPQAEELCVALRRNGIPVELFIYPREGHVVLEPKFMEDMARRNIEWFSRWIK